MASVRERRLGNEKNFLEMLAGLNAGRLEVTSPWQPQDAGDAVCVKLLDTAAYLSALEIVQVHDLRIVFPEYFPASPIEAYLQRPLLHPNIHPFNGFICLWSKHHAGDTIVETLLQVQRVITWQLWNVQPEHTMQPEAVGMTALNFAPLTVPEAYYLDRTHTSFGQRQMRHRLSLP